MMNKKTMSLSSTKLGNILAVLGVTMLFQTVTVSAVDFDVQSRGKWYKVTGAITPTVGPSLNETKLMYVEEVYDGCWFALDGNFKNTESYENNDEEKQIAAGLKIWLPTLERSIQVEPAQFESPCEQIDEEQQQLLNLFDTVRESNKQCKLKELYSKECAALTSFLEKDGNLKIGEWVKTKNKVRIMYLKKDGSVKNTNYNRHIKAAKVIGLDENYLKTLGKARFVLRIMSDDGTFKKIRVLNKHVEDLTKIDQESQSKLNQMYDAWNAASLLAEKTENGGVMIATIQDEANQLKTKWNEDLGKYNTDKLDTDAENRFNGQKKAYMKKHLIARQKLLKTAYPEIEGLGEVKRRRLLTIERLLKETERAQRTA